MQGNYIARKSKNPKTNDQTTQLPTTAHNQHFNKHEHIQIKPIYPQSCGYTCVSNH